MIITILPVVPEATIALICVDESIVKLVTSVPPIVIELILKKPVPFITTVAPAPAEVGVKEVMVGAGGI